MLVYVMSISDADVDGDEGIIGAVTMHDEDDQYLVVCIDQMQD